MFLILNVDLIKLPERKIFKREAVAEDERQDEEPDEELERDREEGDEGALRRLFFASQIRDRTGDVVGRNVADKVSEAVGSVSVAEVVLDVSVARVPTVLSQPEVGSNPGSSVIRFQSSGSGVLNIKKMKLYNFQSEKIFPNELKFCGPN